MVEMSFQHMNLVEVVGGAFVCNNDKFPEGRNVICLSLPFSLSYSETHSKVTEAKHNQTDGDLPGHKVKTEHCEQDRD